jgi:hypothetical protein
MSRITCFMAAAAIVVLMLPDAASAQPDPSAPRVRARSAGAPPPPPPTAFREPGAPGVFTTEQKRDNTYPTYPRGSSGCIEDLGYGRVKYGCD